MKRIHPKLREKLMVAAADYARDHTKAHDHTYADNDLRAACLAILIIIGGNQPLALPSDFQDMVPDWDDKEWCDEVVLERIADALERARKAIREAAE